MTFLAPLADMFLVYNTFLTIFLENKTYLKLFCFYLLFLSFAVVCQFIHLAINCDNQWDFSLIWSSSVCLEPHEETETDSIQKKTLLESSYSAVNSFRHFKIRILS